MNSTRTCQYPTDTTDDGYLLPCGSEKMVTQDVTTNYLAMCIDCRVRRYNEIVDAKEKFTLDTLLKDHSNAYQLPHTSTVIYCIELPTGHLKFGESTKLYDRLTTLHREFGLKRHERLNVIAIRPGCVSSEYAIHQDLRGYKVWTLLREQYEDNEVTRDFAEAIGWADHPDVKKYLTYYSPSRDYTIKPEMDPNR